MRRSDSSRWAAAARIFSFLVATFASEYRLRGLSWYITIAGRDLLMLSIHNFMLTELAAAPISDISRSLTADASAIQFFFASDPQRAHEAGRLGDGRA